MPGKEPSAKRMSRASASRGVFLFGSQAVSLDETHFRTIQSNIVNNSANSWILQVVSELPQLWQDIIQEFPQFDTLSGGKLLQSLSSSFQSGYVFQEASDLPSTLLTPITVITQLVEWSAYMGVRDENSYQDLLTDLAESNVESLGFCTGILSALAVSCSSSVSDLKRHGAAAIRLAVLVGAVVDAHDTANDEGGAISLTTMWTTDTPQAELEEIIHAFPQAYISVRYDQRRSTITVSKNMATTLKNALKRAGIKSSEVGLKGRFHSECHRTYLTSLQGFCDSHIAFQFPDASDLVVVTRSDSGGEPITSGRLHHVALRTILVEQSQWYETFNTMKTSLPTDTETVIVSVGPERCIPPSNMQHLKARVVYSSDMDEIKAGTKTSVKGRAENDIAVIGMSVKAPGADDLEEFWQLLCDAQSQHKEVPSDRISFETTWRDQDLKKTYFGNFVDDYNTFDHKFFQKSPREILATDPQQRKMLEVAYQAVEQSGYFSSAQDKHVGCYIGVSTNDYENHIACCEPNAFSAVGNLRSFIAGKVSHYFGWTGPGLTIDTACSSSAVAIHQACKAILSGECNAALAGGANIITNPLWFQNLAAASFLSPTGQCKPFDQKADGYCRGESIAAVFLKEISTAIKDGNQILGVISSSRVYQNQNCTSIFVPNLPSLSDLFRKTLREAALQPRHVTVVEAHGTGTSVGDPVEYESIKKVLAGNNPRAKPVMFGSVKGLIGHTEGTSGVMSLIKVLLMIQKRMIPPQASFRELNHSIRTTPTDNMEIVTNLRNWDESFRAALINNYGAAGSNASLVVTEPPHQEPRSRMISDTTAPGGSSKYPFWFPGLDDRSLKAYIAKFRWFITTRNPSGEEHSLANLSFNLSRQTNRSLPRALLLNCSSVRDLEQSLIAFDCGDTGFASIALPSSRPVIMCFGGQISTFVGLEVEVYDKCSIFQSHLDQCDQACQSMGLKSIFPGIFRKSRINDLVELQTALFSMQYSCAKAWIDSGIKPLAVTGHSLGELTAVCVSGVLSLKDALKVIASRARIIQDDWGPEKGGMVAVEGARTDVEQLIAYSHLSAPSEEAATIACFNGPQSFTLAGSTKAIEMAEKIASQNFNSIRVKRLNVTNAFHSTLVQPLMAALEDSARDLEFHEPVIPHECATEEPFEGKFSPKFFSEHMRNPVFFHHAVQRLSKRIPSAVWLEAGSNSTVASMASRALGNSSKSSHFQAVNVNSKENALSSLSETTLNLWKEGVRTSFWGHSTLETREFTPILLPPYQFEKNKHWIEMKKPPKAVASTGPVQVAVETELPKGVLTFVGYLDKEKRKGKFRINHMIKEYEDLVLSHKIAQTAPICPATLQIDIAIEAIMSLRPDFAPSRLQPQLQGLENQSALCVDPSRAIWLEVEAVDADAHLWNWRILSNHVDRNTAAILHVSGRIIFRSTDEQQLHIDFARFERLVSHRRCSKLLDKDDAPYIVQGPILYRAFTEIVDYGEVYHGLKKLVGTGNSSAGHVVKPYVGETWLDAPLSDTFCQVAGVYVNCMTGQSKTDMLIATGIESWIRSPKLQIEDKRPQAWDVYASHSNPSSSTWISDIFVFDPQSGALLEVILGIKYQRVAKLSMSRLLTKLSSSMKENTTSARSAPPSAPARIDAPEVPSAPVNGALNEENNVKNTRKFRKFKKFKDRRESQSFKSSNLIRLVKDLLANISGLQAQEISDSAYLGDLGIDSLMGMEMAREIEARFKCTLDMNKLTGITDVSGVIKCVSEVADGVTESILDGLEIDDLEYEEKPKEQAINPASTLGIETVSRTNSASSYQVNVAGYLAEMFGISEADISGNLQLFEIGVDSLLSSQVKRDVSARFGVEIAENFPLEEVTVAVFDSMINRHTQSTSNSANFSKSLRTLITESPTVNGFKGHAETHAIGNLDIAHDSVLEAFYRSKRLTDQFIVENRCANYMNEVLPRQTEFCIALCLDAFEKLGCSIRTAVPGQKLQRVPCIPKLQRFADCVYKMLQTEARLVDITGPNIIRTDVAPPAPSADAILDDLLRDFPDYRDANKLIQLTGKSLDAVLNGEVDGIKLIFGSEEGRELATALYRDLPLNAFSVQQMSDFLKRVIETLPPDKESLKILELGAGTGGFTSRLLPMLSQSGVPIEYTFSDLAPSMVAAARKRFQTYSYMSFQTLDIEKEPTADLLGGFHIVVAHNCIHATHSLTRSTSNIHKLLRPDGFLLMLEMTSPIYWIDMIFGTFEGWWFFDDGREHAISHQSVWQEALQSVGYGHVDWADGHRPEVNFERVIIALASGARYEPSTGPVKLTKVPAADTRKRQVMIHEYIRQNTEGFRAPVPSQIESGSIVTAHSVIVTGASGSLGSHIVAHLVTQFDVKSVVCINRKSRGDPDVRQREALKSRGIKLDTKSLFKLRVIETDASEPKLGLPPVIYKGLCSETTHILHSAWPMSSNRHLGGFEAQFRIMRNLLDFTQACSSLRPPGFKISFQFVSSIATVGHFPIKTGNRIVFERETTADFVLSNGYGEAKFVCEKMLEATLQKFPAQFRAMTVRPGQVAGSKTSGYWNTMEHLPFLIKSSKSLGILPDLDGELSWTPVDDVAATLCDLLLADNIPYPIYHVDNPVRQSWKEMVPLLADMLGIKNVIAFDEWVDRVRSYPGSVEDNPAARLIDFLGDNFQRMSCGGLLLDTTLSREHSKTLARVGPVRADVLRKYVSAWKDTRFLR